MTGKFIKRKDGSITWLPAKPKKDNMQLIALSYKQVERLPDADGKQSRK